MTNYVRDQWPADNVTWVGNDPKWTGAPKMSIYACPGYDHIQGIYASGSEGNGGGAYAYNGGAPVYQQKVRYATDGGIGGDLTGQPVRESAIVSPSQMIAIGDSMIPAGYGVNGPIPINFSVDSAPYFFPIFMDPPWEGHPGPPPDAGAQAMLRRHQGKWNVVFCDAHVEHGRPQMFSTTNPTVC